MRRFFTWSWDYSFGTFQTEEEAQADLKRSVDVVLQSGPENLNELDGWCWGELRGTVHKDGTIVPMPPTPDSEVERLRAELAELQTKVNAIVANFRRESDLCRQPETVNLSRAWAFEDAVDRVFNILSDKPAGERAD